MMSQAISLKSITISLPVCSEIAPNSRILDIYYLIKIFIAYSPYVRNSMVLDLSQTFPRPPQQLHHNHQTLLPI